MISSFFQVGDGRLVILVVNIGQGFGHEAFRQLRVQQIGLFRVGPDLLPELPVLLVDVQVIVYHRRIGVGQGKLVIQLNGLFKIGDRFQQILSLAIEEKIPAFQVQVVGDQVVGGPFFEVLLLFRRDDHLDLVGDVPGDLLLEFKNVFGFPPVLFCPEMAVG